MVLVWNMSGKKELKSDFIDLLDKVWSENNVHFIVFKRGKKLIFTQKINRMILRTGGRVVMTDVDVKTGT